MSRFGRTAALQALFVGVLAAGVALFSGAVDAWRSEPAAPPRFFVAGDLTFTLDGGWEPGGDESALRRLGLDDGVALQPKDSDGTAGLLLGQDRSPSPGLVSPGLAALLGTDRPTSPRVISLPAGDAMLHDSRPDADDDVPRTVAYLLPNTRGLATAVCYARTADAVPSLNSCATMLQTLGLVGARGRTIAPDPQFHATLTSVMEELNARRIRGADDLRGKRSPAGQASAAGRLAQIHQEAAEEISDTPAPEVARGPRDALAASIAGVGAGYTALAQAAQADDRTGYSAARRQVRQAEDQVDVRLEDLRLLGYGVAGPAAAS